MSGRIVRIISNLYTVDINGELFDCHARGKFRLENISPIVGDIVDIDVENKYILKIHSRHNELKRPLIVNVDLAFIVTSVKEPELSLNLLDKMLSVVTFNKVNPVICFTKLDLLKDSSSKKEVKKLTNYYRKIGYPVVFNSQTNKIKKLLKNKLVVLAGQTGAGKSSLINKLDKNLNLKTAPISESLGRGVHTTRHTELFNIAGGKIADAPGFSYLDLSEMKIDDLRDTFIEFKKYKCPFKDCKHLNEKDCAVKDAVLKGKILQSRYDNYVKFASEVTK